MERLTRRVEGTGSRPPSYVAKNDTHKWQLVQRLGELEDAAEDPGRKSIKIRLYELVCLFGGVSDMLKKDEHIDPGSCYVLEEPPFIEVDKLQVVGTFIFHAPSDDEIELLFKEREEI